jgi:hypothetical protein
MSILSGNVLSIFTNVVLPGSCGNFIRRNSMQEDFQTSMSPRYHGQTHQDDHFDDLATFAECVYFQFVLVALKRKLTDDEAHVLARAVEIVDRLHSEHPAGPGL